MWERREQCHCIGTTQREVVWTNDAHDLVKFQATDWAKPVPSNRLQTADLRQRRSQRNRGLRPMTSVLCLRMPTITGTCRGILVIASSLGGQYLSLNPAKKYLIFRIWSAGLKEIGASCVWREVGPWLKPEKPAALGA